MLKQAVKVRFNQAEDFAKGDSANRYTGKTYSYLVTDAQAQEIKDLQAEYVVLRAPTDEGQLKVAKITGMADAAEAAQATRHIIQVVDIRAHQARLQAEVERRLLMDAAQRRAEEIRRAQDLETLAKSDPQLQEIMKAIAALNA
jgi:hypothetical protein